MRMLVVAVLMLVPVTAFAADLKVTQKGRRFNPAEIALNRGDRVVFTNEDEFIHQVYVDAPGFSFDTDERAPGQNITQTFTASGTFEVRCHIHPKMKLAVRVK